MRNILWQREVLGYQVGLWKEHWERKIHWIPPENKDGQFVSSYWQGGFNPEHIDNARPFVPLSTEVRNSKFLQNLILYDFDLTFWDRASTLPIYVGVHFVKLLVRNKHDIAVSSPDLMHRDGEAFTFAHLFNRINVKGGTNYIAQVQFANYKISDVPFENILTQFEMVEQMETYGVCDELVSYYVSPIELEDENLSHGCREIILIDFSPVQQQLR